MCVPVGDFIHIIGEPEADSGDYVIGKQFTPRAIVDEPRDHPVSSRPGSSAVERTTIPSYL